MWVTAHSYKGGKSLVRIKKEDMSQSRQRLLDAAAEEFAHSGYLGANINDISTSAGFAKGTIYNYFPSKHALLMALLDAAAELHLGFIVEQTTRAEDPARRLEAFFAAGFAFVNEYHSLAQVMFNAIHGPHEDFKNYLFQAYQPMFQFVAEQILLPGMQADVFRSVDPQAMASLIMTIYLGTASSLNPEGEPWLEPAQVSDLALHGLLKNDDK